MLEAQTLLISLLSIVGLFFAYRMIDETNPVKAAFSLIAVFLATAVHWFLLDATFLAVLLVLVYVGAVMVLFLFVIMMIQGPEKTQPSSKRKILKALIPFSILAAVGQKFKPMVIELIKNTPQSKASIDIKTLSQTLFSDYLIAFELAGMMLFIGMIAAVALTHRGPRNRRVQEISEQHRAHKADRLTLVRELKP